MGCTQFNFLRILLVSVCFVCLRFAFIPYRFKRACRIQIKRSNRVCSQANDWLIRNRACGSIGGFHTSPKREEGSPERARKGGGGREVWGLPLENCRNVKAAYMQFESLSSWIFTKNQRSYFFFPPSLPSFFLPFFTFFSDERGFSGSAFAWFIWCWLDFTNLMLFNTL